MRTRKTPKIETVLIGGKKVSYLLAALLAQEADLREVLLSDVGDVAIPDPAPTHVEIASQRLSLRAAAKVAAVADARGVQPRKIIEAILDAHYSELTQPKRARQRDTKHMPAGNWTHRSDTNRKGKT